MATNVDKAPQSICANCIDDPHLQQIILNDGKVVVCGECGKTKTPAFTASDFGKLLEPIIRERYAFGEDMRVFHGVDDEKGGLEQQGDPLEYVVSEVLGQDIDFLEDIVEAVIDAEDVWPPDGDEPFYDDCYNYVRRRVPAYEMLDEWQMVHDELTSSRRFSSTAAKKFFADIFNKIDTLQFAPDSGGDYVSVVQQLPAATKIYRARTFDSVGALETILADPFTHVGPPPAHKARAGRMNADGIVVLYCGMDVETTIAEMRPPLGGDTVVITLETTDALRILNFERLEFAFSLDKLSQFDPELDHQLEKHVFLQQLHHLVSQPVLPGKEGDYLITQTMAEYLNHVILPSFDGISFGSVQRDGGTNIVLFSTWEKTFPVTYVDQSIRAFRTNEIEYKHGALAIFKNGKVLRLFSSETVDDF